VSILDAPTPASPPEPLGLGDLERCFGGGIPAVLATASADGVPNVTYLSRAHRVGDDRIALSNQFMSKTSRNLAANPRASLLLMDPVTHDEYRLLLRYERTERRGTLFERLRTDIDGLAASMGMQDVFRLRAADVFLVLDIAQIPPNPSGVLPGVRRRRREAGPELHALAELASWIDRAVDLDVVLDVALEGLDHVLGYPHTSLLLLDEAGDRLYTIASRGFVEASLGAEVRVGEGQIGLVAAQCAPQRITGLRQLRRYSDTVRRAYERSGVRPGREIPMPGLVDADSRIVVPLRALGALVGVLVAESPEVVAFDDVDQEVLTVAASLIGHAIESARTLPGTGDADAGAPAGSSTGPGVAPAADPADVPALPTDAGADRPPVHVRFFPVDGSTFLDGEYLIKGVAGRILWSLLRQREETGRTEFTNRELRLDRTLELPGHKDNLESRLILLKRRLDEREAPMRIDRTGRGRFRLRTSAPVRLDAADG
jgi:hypothetical protein